MPTERLHYDDPLRVSFTARVTGHSTFGGRPSVLLDRSAFYPESGGQLADRGSLAGIAIVDVQVDEAGEVHHALEGPPPAIGAEVAGTIDRARRRIHMALHTGQHMLSRAFVDVAHGETVSSRLGDTACTIDLKLAAVSDADLARAEDLANAVIDDDVPVRAYFPSPAELAELPLRRAPKVSENIRVVDVAGFDVSPCGGTHCLRSGQVGLIAITGAERYKGMVRVTFSAGARARGELSSQAGVARRVGRELSCDALQLPEGLARLRRELGETRAALVRARALLAVTETASWIAAAKATGATRVIASLDDADVDLLRAAGSRITAAGLDALLASPSETGVQVLLAAGAPGRIDCGALLKRIASSSGGRGGGSANRAEGRLPAGADWPALIAVAAP